MTFTLTFKTPDVYDQLWEVAQYYAEQHVANTSGPIDIEQLETEKLTQMVNFAKRFVSYGEVVTLEFNTETKTVTVKEK